MILENKILDFLNSEEKKLKFELLPIGTLEKTLNELGYKMEPLDNTNGWQVDFWVDFRFKGEKALSISGSMYYGNLTIEKCQNQN